MIDGPGGDVDPERAEAVLATMRSSGAPVQRVTYLEQLEGGWSRHSYALRAKLEDGSEAEYILRARPAGSLLDTDLGQEFRTYALLADVPIPTPTVHGLQPDEDTPFQGPFFVMDRLHGRAINVWRRRDRAALTADWEHGRALAEDFAAHLATIHAIPVQTARAAAVARTFIETVDRWQGVYESTRLVADPVIDEAYAWVRDREPDAVAPCLVHGDYRIGNCLIEDRHITGILDWELSSVGDPRFDLGYMALEYHAGKFTTPGSGLMNAIADRAWFHERYSALSGRSVDQEVVRTYTALGALMLFAIMTTGVRVYASGRSDDIRMAWGRFVLPGLRQDLARLMSW